MPELKPEKGGALAIVNPLPESTPVDVYWSEESTILFNSELPNVKPVEQFEPTQCMFVGWMRIYGANNVGLIAMIKRLRRDSPSYGVDVLVADTLQHDQITSLAAQTWLKLKAYRRLPIVETWALPKTPEQIANEARAEKDKEDGWVPVWDRGYH